MTNPSSLDSITYFQQVSNFAVESNKAESEENHSYEQNVIKQLRQSLFSVDIQYRELMLFELLLNKNLCSKFVHDNSFVTLLC